MTLTMEFFLEPADLPDLFDPLLTVDDLRYPPLLDETEVRYLLSFKALKAATSSSYSSTESNLMIPGISILLHLLLPLLLPLLPPSSFSLF